MGLRGFPTAKVTDFGALSAPISLDSPLCGGMPGAVCVSPRGRGAARHGQGARGVVQLGAGAYRCSGPSALINRSAIVYGL